MDGGALEATGGTDSEVVVVLEEEEADIAEIEEGTVAEAGIERTESGEDFEEFKVQCLVVKSLLN